MKLPGFARAEAVNESSSILETENIVPIEFGYSENDFQEEMKKVDFKGTAEDGLSYGLQNVGLPAWLADPASRAVIFFLL